MNIFKVFIPHIFVFIIGIFWFLVSAWLAENRGILIFFISISVYCVLFFIIVGLIPSPLIRARPTKNRNADTVIILGFGYTINVSNMKPGKSNQFLLDWTLNNYKDSLKLILVQEGVWVAADKEALQKLGIKIMRIHRHDPNINLNTFDTAFCAIELLKTLDKNKVILVAHDLQLQRAIWDFKRIGRKIYPECTFIVPDIPDTPFDPNSKQFQTRYEFIYKIGELLIARPRDFFSPIPTRCKAPVEQNS